MPRKALDDVVLDALMRRVLDPDHLRGLLAGMLDRSEDAEKHRRQKLAVARTARTESQKAIHNLLTLVESGALSPTDGDIVERIASHRQRERTLGVEIDGLERQLHISKRRITEGMIDKFGDSLASALRDGDANFRRRYVSLLIDRVEVSNDMIRLCGSRHAIEHAFIAGDGDAAGAVPIFDRKWCPGKDSNLHDLAVTGT